MPSRLGIFAKFWQPGSVKTRLAASIGPVAAAQLHRCCLQTLLARLAGAADVQVLAYTPQVRRDDFAQAVSGTVWQLQPQAEGDLGARMQDFFSASIAAGAERTVLIGSDSPDLPLSLINEGLNRLQEYPVVLGPSHDGGYYLIGLQRAVPPIFSGISWSTADVWQQTIDRLEQTGWRYLVLPPWYDVDEWPDLLRLQAELEKRVSTEPELSPLYEVVRQTVGSRDTSS